MTVPNALSAARIAAVPLLLVLAWTGQPTAFVVMFALAALTDALDGWLARRLNQVSELGARFDSIGYLALYFSLPLAAWWLWPDLMRREAWWIAAAVATMVVPLAAGFVRFGRLPSHHTLGAKTMTAVLPFACLALLLGHAWVFHLAVLARAVVAIEELAITFTLPAWHTPVPTFARAVALRRAAAKR